MGQLHCILMAILLILEGKITAVSPQQQSAETCRALDVMIAGRSSTLGECVRNEQCTGARCRSPNGEINSALIYPCTSPIQVNVFSTVGVGVNLTITTSRNAFLTNADTAIITLIQIDGGIRFGLSQSLLFGLIMLTLLPVTDIPVQCIICEEGDVRLVGGEDESSGRVEVCHDNVWGGVCSSLWDDSDAEVVCRQLGFMEDNPEALFSGFTRGPSTLPIWLTDVACGGDELSLLDCGDGVVGAQRCNLGEDAGVNCAGGLGTSGSGLSDPEAATRLTVTESGTRLTVTGEPGTVIIIVGVSCGLVVVLLVGILLLILTLYVRSKHTSNNTTTDHVYDDIATPHHLSHRPHPPFAVHRPSLGPSLDAGRREWGQEEVGVAEPDIDLTGNVAYNREGCNVNDYSVREEFLESTNSSTGSYEN